MDQLALGRNYSQIQEKWESSRMTITRISMSLKEGAWNKIMNCIANLHKIVFANIRF
ncbi:hypothetical protein PPBDW_u10011 [Photobacterium kishitanii]|nr:hypothetical protein PPBDW_u10011 [Photobacterium kishitanii]